jgi:hypothetical protein
LGKPQKTQLELNKLERFIRIVELPLHPGDTLRGYQPEIIWVEGDRVVRRKLVDKPNLFEYAYTNAGELIDPRNESFPDA